MTIKDEINNFFNKYGNYFDDKSINYTKQVVYSIKTSQTLKNFLDNNNISASILLNEIIPYSQWKLTQYGDEKLDMKEIQSVLNVIIFSNEIEKLMLENHITLSSIGIAGEIYYKADKYATNYFNDKYGLGIIKDQEFDFTILDEREGLSNNIGDFGFN